MKKQLIVIHQNLINNKCFVDKIEHNTAKSTWLNIDYYENSPKFSKALEIYGWNNFDTTILPKIYDTKTDLEKAMKFLIEDLNSHDNGYNRSRRVRPATSEETKRKISEARKRQLSAKNIDNS